MSRSRTELFRTEGYLHLQGFHAASTMRPIKRQVLEALERKGVASAGTRVPRALQGLTPFQQTARLSTLVRVPRLEALIVDEKLRDVMIELTGRNLPLSMGMELLLSLPRQGDWTLHRLNWHVDTAAPSPERLPGIQVFALVDDVAPRGGATLALSGSHRLSHGRSGSHAALREALRTAQDVETSIGKQCLSLVEMSGRAGDVFLMDMRTLHAPSINSSGRLRMMATSRYVFDP